jgi:hypothetical protein
MIRPIRDGSQKRSTCFRNISIERSYTSIRSFKKIKEGGFGSVIKAIASCTILISFFLNFSCEREKEVVVQPQVRTNRPPFITTVTIIPQSPNKGNDLDLIIQSQDPDGDPVTYHYQWIKNNEEILGEDKNILKIGNFKKGDLIQVKVTPSDGKTEGRPFLSDPVKILNSPPVIQELWIEPKMVYANDPIRVHIKSNDFDGDSIYYTYRWEKNGVVLTEERAEVLEAGRFKKGDLIIITVTPDDRESQGPSIRSQPIMILNSPPVIVSSPPTSVKENDYIYQVKAYDPDNDPISFALKSGPKGMEIDKDTGLIRWAIRGQDRGTHSIEIEASDKEGARSFQRFALNVEIG